MDDGTLRKILTQARVIAVVGHSHKPERPSYQIAQFLRAVGYTVYPVNPAQTAIDGQPCFASLQALPEPVDIVNVFRQSHYLPEIAEAAIEIAAKTLWAQLGIQHSLAAERAASAGLEVVMDRCIKIEYLRLQIPPPHPGAFISREL